MHKHFREQNKLMGGERLTGGRGLKYLPVYIFLMNIEIMLFTSVCKSNLSCKNEWNSPDDRFNRSSEFAWHNGNTDWADPMYILLC